MCSSYYPQIAKIKFSQLVILFDDDAVFGIMKSSKNIVIIECNYEKRDELVVLDFNVEL